MATPNQNQPLSPLGVQASKPQRSVKKVVWIFIACLVVAATVWYFFFYDRKKIPETPEDVLRGLSEISTPVTATPAERTLEVKALEKSSAPVQKTQAQRLEELEALEQAE